MYWLSIIEFKIFTFFHQPIIEVPPNTLLFPDLTIYGISCPLSPLQLQCSSYPSDLQSPPSTSSTQCELHPRSTCQPCIASIGIFLRSLPPFLSLWPSSCSMLLTDQVGWGGVRLHRIQRLKPKFQMVGSHLPVFSLGWVQRTIGRGLGLPWVHSTWRSNFARVFWFFVRVFWNRGLVLSRRHQCDHRRLGFCYRRFSPWG